jgi:hypothetical protein
MGRPSTSSAPGTLTPDRIGDGQVTLRHHLPHAARAARYPRHHGGDGLTAEAVVRVSPPTRWCRGGRLRPTGLSVALSPDNLSVSGPAELSGVPMTGTWRARWGRSATRASVLEARAVIDRPGLAALGVVLPDWLMSGAGRGGSAARPDRRRARPVARRKRSRRDRSVDSRARLAHGRGRPARWRSEVLLGPRRRSRFSTSPGRVCR